MNRREFLRNSGALLGGLAIAPLTNAKWLDFNSLPQDAQGQRYAEGFVFHDRGGNGMRSEGDEGIAGICVSNGIDVVKTDRTGKWRLPVDEDTILFVIKPKGWSVPVDHSNLPRYYYIHKPAGSPTTKYAGISPTGPLPTSVDFPLTPQEESSKFRMVLFGDPQPRNQTEIDYISHDVVEQVARDARDVDAKFGLSLGDEMFDNLSLYDSLNGSIAAVGLPWYNTVGNHDMNYDAPDDALSTETFKRVFGPTYYAFNYGDVHFIVLDDVIWHGAAMKGYHGEITTRQLDFVKNDLAHVPKNQLVVVAMHIPIVDVENREALYRLLEDRPHTLSFSAHTHVQRNYFLTEKDGWKGRAPHHHLNHATVCGSWWQGAPDERGVPHATMSDGVPNGYSIVEFDGSSYKVQFRPASRPEAEHMLIWLPDVVSKYGTPTEVIANIFAGSERSKVEMRIANSPWLPMANFVSKDPYFLRLKELEKTKFPGGLPLPEPSETNHLWKATLPAGIPLGVHAVEVRTTDMYGQTFTDRRIVRVVL